MAKSLGFYLSFKNTSEREEKLFECLISLDDRGNQIKQVLGEIFLPELYNRNSIGSKSIANKQSKNNISTGEVIDITDF